MKKSEFLDLLSKKLVKEKVEITKKGLETTLKIIFDSIGDIIKKDDAILIPGFGSFKRANRSARTARNPQTGTTMKIKAKKVPKFKAAVALKEKVK